MIILDRKKKLSFDDVLILPQYSEVQSRKDVSLSTNFLGLNLSLPIVSSNMASVTGANMASAMAACGAIGCLHRFNPISANEKEVTDLRDTPHLVSIGIGDKEFERAEALYRVGSRRFVIDVAHGANKYVIDQVLKLRRKYKDSIWIVAGNFATGESLGEFFENGGKEVDAVKVGIGSGSACTTRIVTGCGIPLFASIVECSSFGVPIIADGGMRNSGDIAKALGAGASLVMLGRMLAGADESNAPIFQTVEVIGYENASGVSPVTTWAQTTWQSYNYVEERPPTYPTQTPTYKRYKKYSGSASEESYESQGKLAVWRTAEGESFNIELTGPVADTLQKIEAGIRSALSYVGASNLEEFRAGVEFATVSGFGAAESKAHGKTS